MGCLAEDGNGPLFLYLLVVQVATQISGPYFTPFMLKQLALSYWDYVLLIATAFLAKIVFLPAVGSLADRFGSRRLLWLGGMAIVPISALWAVSDRFFYLMAVQVLSGMAWAAYELAVLLLAFEKFPSRRRVGLLTAYNVASATAILIGSLLGGALLAALGQTRDAYLTLFLISSAGRALPLLLLRLPGMALEPSAAARPEASLPQGPHWGRVPKRVEEPWLADEDDESDVPAAQVR